MVLVARDKVGLYTITSSDERAPGIQVSEEQLLEFFNKGRTLTGNRVIALFKSDKAYHEFIALTKNNIYPNQASVDDPTSSSVEVAMKKMGQNRTDEVVEALYRTHGEVRD